MERSRIKEFFGYKFVANDWSKMIHSAKHSNKRCSVFEQKNARYVTRKEAKKLISESGYVGCVCTKAQGLYKYKSPLMDAPIEKPRTGGGTHA